MNLLIPNLGTTSLKYQILEMPSEKVLAKGREERVTNFRDAIARISTGGTPIDAVHKRAADIGLISFHRATIVDQHDGTLADDLRLTRAMRPRGGFSRPPTRENLAE